MVASRVKIFEQLCSQIEVANLFRNVSSKNFDGIKLRLLIDRPVSSYNILLPE